MRTFAAEDWAAPARALEKKIAGKLKPGHSVVLSLRNLSSLSSDEADRVRGEIETEMRAEGLRVIVNERKTASPPDALSMKDESDTQIRVTLAENLHGYLWIAEIAMGESREVVMQAVPRVATAERPASVPAFLLRSQKLLEQDAPILDFGVIDASLGQPRLLVLEPARVVLHVFEEGRWQPKQSASLPEPEKRPRDRRGRLRLTRASFEIFLPGIHCQGTAGQTLSVECGGMEQLWEFELGDRGSPQATLAAGKNFFSSKTSNAVNRVASLPPFFSAAGVKANGESIWAVAGLDGRARIYNPEKSTEALAAIAGWGSDIAGLDTDCGTSWQILATRAGDWTERDAVQAFEIQESQAMAVSPPLEFAGPVMALWRAEAGGTAEAVVRNLQTGRYEAHTLSLSCGR